MYEAIVIGGGIGGLSAAVAMQRQGIGAHVFEAAPELREVGAGLWVPSNAMHVLEQVGLAEAVREAGYAIEVGELHDCRDGLLQAVRFRDFIGADGHATVAMQRSALQAILASGLAPDTLHTGKVLEAFSAGESGRVRARFTDGTEVEAAVLVGADGLHSVVRRKLFPDVKLRYSGQSSYRALVDAAPLSDLHHASREIWGPGRRFGFSAVGGGRIYWYATWDAPPGGRDAPGEAAGRLAELARGFPDPVGELLDATDEARLVRTDLFDFRPLSSWHRGRVVLLGDAAHATTPNLGQGGAQAMEDGWALARSLAGSRSPEDAIRRYEGLRMSKAKMVVRRSWQLGKLSHWKHPVARTLRNAMLRRTPPSVGRRQLEALYSVEE